VFISGAEAAELDAEVAAADEDCAGLDDEDNGVEAVGVAEDCVVEDGVAED
jgi:hypothetical protein